ncbi:MAG: hypothetical protein ACREWE_16430 [Gammaproteobacteria bacterium]
MAGTRQGGYDWMVSEYRRIAGLPGQRVARRPSGCGRAGYGVFVRSDTNVEAGTKAVAP